MEILMLFLKFRKTDCNKYWSNYFSKMDMASFILNYKRSLNYKCCQILIQILLQMNQIQNSSIIL